MKLMIEEFPLLRRSLSNWRQARYEVLLSKQNKQKYLFGMGNASIAS